VDSSVQKRLSLLQQSASKDNDASSSIADLIILRFGELNEKLKKFERKFVKLNPDLGNLSTKNRLRERFSGSKSRQATRQGFSGRISDRRTEQVFKTETGF
jgi:hypothetical protein